MKQTKQELRLAYEVACTNYLAAFMEMYDISCEPHPWVADEVGTVALVGDDYFNIEEIRLCVDNEIPWDEVSEWQDYNEEAACLGLDLINLKSWHMGYRGVPKERRDRIKSLRRELEDLVEQTKQEEKEGGMKMKANELTIGDWVYRPDCYDQVKEIRHTGVIGIDGMRGLITFSELEPIPLTPEILESNQFVHGYGDSDFYDYEKWEKKINDKTIIVIKDNSGWFCRVDDKMVTRSMGISPFVHIVQHILRIGGVENEIELEP